MYDGNPGEIDFGSSYREVRVSEGSSYRESTVVCARNKLFGLLGDNVIKTPARYISSENMEGVFIKNVSGFLTVYTHR